MPSEVLMQRTANHNLPLCNSRSVLKPEYMPWNSDSGLEYDDLSDAYESRRTNTNTAPVYSLGNPGPPKRRCLPKRQSVHPYSRYMSDFALPGNRGSYASELPRKPRHTGSSPQRHSSHYDAWSAKSSRFSHHHSGRTKHEEPSPQKSSRSAPRTVHHGQAEQLRRSRESNTFALIDSQLSKSPLDKIREMYLQSKGVSTAVGSVPRTTKKANLSAVHTIVRFRIRDYLIDLKEHSRRLMDHLMSAASSQEVNNPRCTKDAESFLSSLNSIPCSRDSHHCDRLQTRWERSRSVRRPLPSSHAQIPVHPRSAIPTVSSSTLSQTQQQQSLPPQHRQQQSSRSVVHRVPLSAIGNKAASNSSYYSSSESYDPHSSPMDFPSPPPPQPSADLALSSIHTFKEEEDEELESKQSHDQKLLSMLDYQVDSSNEDNSGVRLKRQRLDSNVSRLCLELGFDQVDWSASSIELGPTGDEPVDLQSLILDTASPLTTGFDMPRSPCRRSAGDDTLYSPNSGGSDGPLLSGSELFN